MKTITKNNGHIHLFFVLALALVLVSVSFYVHSSNKTSVQGINSGPVALRLAAKSSVEQGENFAVVVRAVPQGSVQISAVDLRVKYDPNKISFVGLKTEGALLPEVLAPATVSGNQVSAVIAAPVGFPMTTVGTVTTLQFKALSKVNRTSIMFNTGTSVSLVDDFERNALGKTTNATLRITN